MNRFVADTIIVLSLLLLVDSISINEWNATKCTSSLLIDARIHLSVEKGTFYFDARVHNTVVGNYATVYYNARGFAKALGLCFEATGLHHSESWISKHFPTRVCPPSGIQQAVSLLEEHLTVIKQVCTDCGNVEWIYPHECPGFWIQMRKEMQIEIAHAVEQAEAEQSILPNYLGANHAVVYSRCKIGDSFMCHGAYGPPGFSFYDPLKDSKIQHIIIVGMAAPGICSDIHHALESHLKKINPIANITFQSKGVLQDFSIMMRAPVLFLDMSTFGMIAALASNATVHAIPFFGHEYPLEGFIYSKTELLYPTIGNEIGVTIDCNKSRVFSSTESEKIINWLESH